MGLSTPFSPENRPKPLERFGFHKIQRQAKSVLIGIMENFFSSLNSEYAIKMPELIEVQTMNDVEKVFIKREFPYEERKLPLILVAIKGATERKMYIGADNFLTYVTMTTSTGKKIAVEKYHGAADMSFSIIIVAESPDDRERLADLLAMCFTHYYRWQYFYTTGDGDTFTIVPNTTQLEFGAQQTATEEKKVAMLYIVDISLKAFVEYTFTGNDIFQTLNDYTIDNTSGPIEQDFSI